MQSSADGINPNGYLRASQIVGRPAGSRTKAIIGLLPMHPNSWWKGVKAGRYPQPIKLGPRMTVWKASDILALLQPKTEDQTPTQN